MWSTYKEANNSMKKKGLGKKIKKISKMLHHKQVTPVPVLVSEERVLEGRVALITGGTRGLGLEFARTFANCGCDVIVSGRNKDALAEAVKELGEQGRSLFLDATDINSFDEKVKEANTLFNKPVDILVNCAGVHNHHGFLDTDVEEFELIMKTNLEGMFFLSQAVANSMIKHKIKGHILNVSSSAALRPASNTYQLSKWGVRGLTLGMADVLLPYGIIVNAIAPGPTATDMLIKDGDTSLYKHDSLIGRYEHPIEIANLAKIMVSDIGNMIVGDTIYVTGGSGVISLHK